MSPTESGLPAPPDFSRISSPPGVNPEPEPETRLERTTLENARLKLELEGLSQDTAERKKYASLFFYLSCAWILIITVLLLFQGFGSFWFGKFPFKLSEPIVLATIGSTTVNILGILYIVANYLFPKKGPFDKT
jgi:hypothetical protein